ncbi:MAG: hypothetical protein QG608_2059 [Actinomycetota bacterium]|nr:hypothetical protein [Actinomycetota bacterium]
MRADAARNRDAVLDAAGHLLDTAPDPDMVSMDDVAAAAGVGKGTLFRHFGDRVGLLRALYEERGARLQEQLRTLPPGRPAEQVLALLYAVLHFKIQNRTLTLALESSGGGSPYNNITYHDLHATLTELITRARGPRSADFLAHALLAAVRSDLVTHLQEWPDERLYTGLAELTEAVLEST